MYVYLCITAPMSDLLGFPSVRLGREATLVSERLQRLPCVSRERKEVQKDERRGWLASLHCHVSFF